MPIFDDDIVENNESIVINATVEESGLIPVSFDSSVAQITIIDDDSKPASH